MPSVGRDVRSGARLLAGSPGFTAAALALGLGASPAIFRVVDAVLLKSPHPDADRLLFLWERNPSQNQFKLQIAGGNFLESITADHEAPVNLTQGPISRVDAEGLRVLRVSAGLLPLLGVQPIVGRLFRADKVQPCRRDTALLSYAPWQRLDTDRTVGGKTARLNQKSYTVVGVTPRGFRVPVSPAGVWIPVAIASLTQASTTAASCWQSPRCVQVFRCLSCAPIGVGPAGAWALTGLMASMLYRVAPTDPFTFVAIPVLLGAVVLLAGYLPARRAVGLDPAAALRHV